MDVEPNIRLPCCCKHTLQVPSNGLGRPSRWWYVRVISMELISFHRLLDIRNKLTSPTPISAHKHKLGESSGMAFLGLCGGTATKYSLHDNSVYDGLFVAMGTFFLAWTILWLWMYKRGDIEYFKMKMPMYVFYMASTIAMTVLHFVPVNYNCFDTESVACPPMLSDTEAVEGWKIKGKKALLLVDAIFMLLNFVQSFPYAKLLANQMMNMDELDKETQTVVLEMFQGLGGFGAATMANIAFCAYASLENYDAIMMAGTLKGYSVRVSLMVLPIFGAGINLLVGSIMFLVGWRRGAANNLNFKMPFFWFYQVQFWVFAILFFLATDYDLVGLPLSD